MKQEFFIIRHGETDFNLQGIVQGRGVNPSLNETGRKQSMLFYARFSEEPFERVYTSSLRRTHETVKGFIDKGIPWEQHPGLDEISWGIFEGKRASHDFKVRYRDLIRKWDEGYLDEKADNGESPNEVQQRQLQVINYMIEQPVKKVLICMHGRAMRIFLPTLLGESLARMDQYPHHNLTLYKLIYNDGRFSINLFNNMDHLIENGKN